MKYSFGYSYRDYFLAEGPQLHFKVKIWRDTSCVTDSSIGDVERHLVEFDKTTNEDRWSARDACVAMDEKTAVRGEHFLSYKRAASSDSWH